MKSKPFAYYSADSLTFLHKGHILPSDRVFATEPAISVHKQVSVPLLTEPFYP